MSRLGNRGGSATTSATERHRARYGVSPIEIEPGRAVPNNWDDHLFEPYAKRKARRLAEKPGTP